MHRNLRALLIFTIFIKTPLFAQIYQGTLQVGLKFSTSRSMLYAGIDNDYELNSNLATERWEIISTNGTVNMYYPGFLTVNPEREGIDSISFYFITDSNTKKLVLIETMPVMKLPTPQIVLGKNNKIGLTELKNLKQLSVRIPNLLHNIQFFIKQCKVVTIKTTGVKNEFIQTGNVLNDAIKKQFVELTKGDLVIIKDVKAIRDKEQSVEDAEGVFVVVD